MGCDEMKDSNVPKLLGFFEDGNEEQKQYCINLKNNFQHAKTIGFTISSTAGVPFSIQLKVPNQPEPYKIQEDKIFTEEAMKTSLKKMYDILDQLK